MLNLEFVPNDAILSFQVETIGDAYMVVSGAPEPDRAHAHRIARQAFAMVREASQVRNPVTKKGIQVSDDVHFFHFTQKK